MSMSDTETKVHLIISPKVIVRHLDVHITGIKDVKTGERSSKTFERGDEALDAMEEDWDSGGELVSYKQRRALMLAIEHGLVIDVDSEGEMEVRIGRTV